VEVPHDENIEDQYTQNVKIRHNSENIADGTKTIPNTDKVNANNAQTQDDNGNNNPLETKEVGEDDDNQPNNRRLVEAMEARYKSRNSKHALQPRCPRG
jgi:hypothetical protein